jgi:ankyrin repeat protein
MNHSLIRECAAGSDSVFIKAGQAVRIARWLLALVVALALLPWVGRAGAPGTLGQQLIEAAKREDLSQVRSLLESGADVNTAGDQGLTALMAASLSGHLEIAKLLTGKGANVNAKTHGGWTALMIGVGSHHSAVVELLIEKGAKVDERALDGRTALTEAVRNDAPDLAMLLLDHGADINARGCTTGHPLGGACGKVTLKW